MTTRRQILKFGAFGMLAPGSALAQARRRIGIVGSQVPLERSVWAPGIVQGLKELGYGESVEYRLTDGTQEGYARVAKELVRLNCDLIIAMGPEASVRAVQAAGGSASVIFVAVDYDPVERGIVTNMRRPDRNTTGVYVQQNEMVAKRVDIMREVLPRAKRFLVLADPFSKDQVPSARKAADAARVALTVIEFDRPPHSYAAAFAEGRKARAEALIGLASPTFSANAATIAGLTSEHRLPAIGSGAHMAQAGQLLGLGADAKKVGRRAAEMGVRILKGAKPADLPVELADEFELTVNAKTAQALGVKVPESVLARATRIVQ